MRKPRQPWPLWKLLGVQLVVVLGLGYAALEGWSRLFPPADKVVWPATENHETGPAFRPGSRVVATNGLDFRVEVRSNEAGFLDRPLPPLSKPPGACRIAILGDSFVEAAQVPIAAKLQVRLEEMLRARWPGRPVESMAFGFSGTGQLNQLAWLEAFARPRRPDVIALVFVSNDFANNSALLEAMRVGWHPQHPSRIFARETADGAIELVPAVADWRRHLLPRVPDERPWLHAQLHRISRFYRWLYAKLTLRWPAIAQRMGREPTGSDLAEFRRTTLAAIDPAGVGGLEGWSPTPGREMDAVFAEPDPLPATFMQAVRFTGFAFDTFAARARADGARLVVLGTHELPERTEARLAGLLAPRGIPYVSLKAHIARHGGRITDAHWPHDAHWSLQGHAWAAEALAAWLADSGACGA